MCVVGLWARKIYWPHSSTTVSCSGSAARTSRSGHKCRVPTCWCPALCLLRPCEFGGPSPVWSTTGWCGSTASWSLIKGARRAWRLPKTRHELSVFVFLDCLKFCLLVSCVTSRDNSSLNCEVCSSCWWVVFLMWTVLGCSTVATRAVRYVHNEPEFLVKLQRSCSFCALPLLFPPLHSFKRAVASVWQSFAQPLVRS